MQQNKLVHIPTSEIFLYLFTAMLRDVTITSLLRLCIICYILMLLVIYVANMGRISKADCFLIMGLRKDKKWGAKRLRKEFPGKRWPKTSTQKTDNHGTIERKSGSGGPRCQESS